MSHSRFSSVPPPVAGPHLAPLALLASASRVRGRGWSPAHFQEETVASSAKSENSPSLAKGCSFGGMCDHLDLRFVGELGGHVGLGNRRDKNAIKIRIKN